MTDLTQLTSGPDVEHSIVGRSDLGELQRAVADPVKDPELPTHGTVGGRLLERTFSLDPQAFPEPNSRQEIWRFAALPRLRPLFAGPDASSEIAFSWPAGAPVEVVPMTDPRVGSVHTPFDSSLPPNDVDLFLMGDTEVSPELARLAVGALNRPYVGHILDLPKNGGVYVSVKD